MKRIRIEEPEKKILFYAKLPIANIDYCNFKEKALDRIKQLKTLESKHELFLSLQPTSYEDDVKSHFCAKLICAQTMWSVKWFISMETLLFTKKIQILSNEEVKGFFFNDFIPKLNGMTVDNEKKIVILKHNMEYTGDNQNIKSIKNYAINVHFSKVIDAIQKHEIEIKQGFVSINENLYKIIIINAFRKYLEKEMILLYAKCRLDNDERMFKLHHHLFDQNLLVSKSEFTTIKNMEAYFPPCITGLISKLKKIQHLKYVDRLTLVRFFKDINMPVDDCIKYFKNNFKAGKTDAMKEYTYMIRHSYGLEGSRKSYKSYYCQKVISFSDGKDSYGCPFVRDLNYVSKYANDKNIKKDDIRDIEDIAKKGEYQIACTKVLQSCINTTLSINETVDSPFSFYNKYTKAYENKGNNDEKAVDKDGKDDKKLTV
ncbi:hypothetical protein EDEG_01622 [Edhazardia aedis USNM 41457]|uniref:DNA primase large subunit C-terminal domain-containing protein n=1 Tax=Edhazardia aedis (strain USNM 41457) TaxID=1003232 RepID=J9DNJ3_EDHAE|nr:hypothetical protein EDEG_01622 [Edhazardia aedis USNM 41457]|eukprot:EJW04100.1 hypothetical protein EDEG_01622 [Edhazardia aedis USNM 41457]